MKTRFFFIVASALVLSSCGTSALLTRSNSDQQYQDGIYYRPQVVSTASQQVQETATNDLIEKTKSSKIFVKTLDRVDTLFVPDNMSAKFTFDKKNEVTTLSLYDNRTLWLDYAWEFGSPFWYDSWHSTWYRSMYSFYSPWYGPLSYRHVMYSGLYSPFWYNSWMYDPYWAYTGSFYFDPFFYDPFYFHYSPYLFTFYEPHTVYGGRPHNDRVIASVKSPGTHYSSEVTRSSARPAGRSVSTGRSISASNISTRTQSAAAPSRASRSVSTAARTEQMNVRSQSSSQAYRNSANTSVPSRSYESNPVRNVQSVPSVSRSSSTFNGGSSSSAVRSAGGYSGGGASSSVSRSSGASAGAAHRR